MLPAVCACALAIVCRSRRNSATSLPIAPSLFESFEFCTTSHTTSPISNTTTTINTASMYAFSLPRSRAVATTPPYTYSPLYAPSRLSENPPLFVRKHHPVTAIVSQIAGLCAASPPNKKGAATYAAPGFSPRLIIALKQQLQRKLKLPRIIRRRRLPRRASRPRPRIAQLIHRRHIQPIRQIESICDHIQLEPLPQREPPRQPHIKLEKSWRHIRIAPQIPDASQRRRNPRHRERRPRVRQTRRRRFERHSRYKRRSRRRSSRPHRRPPVRRPQIQPIIRPRDYRIRSPRRNLNNRRHRKIRHHMLPRRIPHVRARRRDHSARHPPMPLIKIRIPALIKRKPAVLRLQRRLQIRRIIDRM